MTEATFTESELNTGSSEAIADDTEDLLLDQAQAPTEAQAQFKGAQVFKQFSGSGKKSDKLSDVDLVMDIPVQMTVELGRTKIAIRNLLQLAQGSIVELDGRAGEPLKMLVNGCLLAQGEVVVVNDKFGIRLTEIVAPSERMQKLSS